MAMNRRHNRMDALAYALADEKGRMWRSRCYFVGGDYEHVGPVMPEVYPSKIAAQRVAKCLERTGCPAQVIKVRIRIDPV